MLHKLVLSMCIPNLENLASLRIPNHGPVRFVVLSFSRNCRITIRSCSSVFIIEDCWNRIVLQYHFSGSWKPQRLKKLRIVKKTVRFKVCWTQPGVLVRFPVQPSDLLCPNLSVILVSWKLKKANFFHLFSIVVAIEGAAINHFGLLKNFVQTPCKPSVNQNHEKARLTSCLLMYAIMYALEISKHRWLDRK